MITRQNIKLWQKNSPAGFRNWISDVQPRILHKDGKYRIFHPTDIQNEVIDATLDSKNNIFKNSMSVSVWPRRHGKSVLNSLLCIYFFTSRSNFVIGLLGSSEMHARRVQFNLISRIILNTPILNEAIGEKNILNWEIRYPQLNNIIQICPTNLSTSYGDRLNILYVADLHSSADYAPWQALQSSLLDSEGSLILVDSNVDYEGSTVSKLQDQAKWDDTVYCNYLSYTNFEDYKKRRPPWINIKKAEGLKNTLLPSEYRRSILGLPSDIKNSLFPTEIIEKCKSPYKMPVEDVPQLLQGRAHRIAGGLDRSKSLFGGDNTVWSVVAKVANENGEFEIYLLNEKVIIPNTSKAVKSAIYNDHKKYGLSNICLENYEVTDLKGWCDDQQIENELISATSTMQNASFPELHRLARESRLYFPETAKGLIKEMSTFAYSQKPGGRYSFGHVSQRFKDDRLYAINLAIYALREVVLSLYTLSSFQCHNKSSNHKWCYLLGGSQKLFCSRDCLAAERVNEMFKEFKAFKFDDERTIQEFYHDYVRRTGSVITQVV